jgi:hypothetical protein
VRPPSLPASSAVPFFGRRGEARERERGGWWWWWWWCEEERSASERGGGGGRMGHMGWEGSGGKREWREGSTGTRKSSPPRALHNSSKGKPRRRGPSGFFVERLRVQSTSWAMRALFIPHASARVRKTVFSRQIRISPAMATRFSSTRCECDGCLNDTVAEDYMKS